MAAGIVAGLWDTLKTVAERRGVTHDHEARWLNLTGFCLRPGWGDPLDAHRIEQVWKIVVGGPENPPQQSRLGGTVDLLPAHRWRARRQSAEGTRQAAAADRAAVGKEIVAAAGSAGHGGMLASGGVARTAVVDQKVELGREALRLLSKPMPPQHLFWAITRLGTRAPLYGPINEVARARKSAPGSKSCSRCRATPPTTPDLLSRNSQGCAATARGH